MADIVALPSTAARLWARASHPFRGLDRRAPSSWPLAPRLLLCVAIAGGLVAALWFALVSPVVEELHAVQAEEARLRDDFRRKLPQALNLEALRAQRQQVQQHVTQLEKQLPGRAEMDALLSEINQAGLSRRLHFDLFRPGQVSVRAYYAELPVALKVFGRYHDIGAFAADIADLSRIVTLNNIALVPAREGNLVLEATAKTFRYLDPDEIAAQRGAKAASAPAAGGRK